MLLNHVRLAWRNLLKGRSFSVINVSGLAVGMAVAMLIGLWIHDELSYDRHHDNYDRIAQVYQHQTFSGDVVTHMAVPLPLASDLKTTYRSDFKRVVIVWWPDHHILSIGEKSILQYGTFMEPEGLNMFSLQMTAGGASALDNSSSIILSESAAKALFGEEDPMDKALRIDNRLDAKVTGVFKDLPYNTKFGNTQIISSWDLWLSSIDILRQSKDNYSNNSFNIYVELEPHGQFEQVTAKIKNLIAEHDKGQAATKPEVFLHPMSRWHLFSEWDRNGESTGGRIQFVWLFGIIGAFVLLLACINFMNLSTARSEKRAKEVGIRKSIGSAKGQLIYQFLGESLLIVLLAFFAALALFSLSLPWFNELADKKMEVPWLNPYFWGVSALFILITSLISGSYPALYLSSFRPVAVLKGTFKAGRLATTPRKILVVVQFVVSVTLIIGTIVVYRQIDHAKNRPVGYSREGLLMVQKRTDEFFGKFDVIRNELTSSGAAMEVAESSSPATEVWHNNGGFEWKGKDPAMVTDVATMGVTHEYGATVGWEFVRGRDFSREFSTDSVAVVLNEAAVSYMGFTEPVGQEIKWSGRTFTVIGVIRNMIMSSPFEPVKQTVFLLDYDRTLWINIRMDPRSSPSEGLARIERVFQRLIPGIPFVYKFVDVEYNNKFAGEERISKLSTFFAGLAIFISCLGIFGLASFVAEQRTKEIGIRKILGASLFGLWKMLSREFVVLVTISCLVATPAAHYFLGQWLSTYEYRTEISWWVYALSAGGALVVTLATVSFQSIRAAMMNPVESLRNE